MVDRIFDFDIYGDNDLKKRLPHTKIIMKS